ncbi:hypothetical protein IT575_11900 [bacterium]|nr:hypothetical protein [bacterium]
MTDNSMVDAAVEALRNLMQERRWAAPQVAAEAGRSGISVSEDTVLRVLKRERKPSLEFGIWLLRQSSSEHRFPLRPAEWEETSHTEQLNRPAPPRSTPRTGGAAAIPKQDSSNLQSAAINGAVQRDLSPEMILRQIREQHTPAEDQGSAELVPLLKQLLERLNSQPALNPVEQPAKDKLDLREANLRRIEDLLIKDVDEAAAARLELAELKRYRPRVVARAPRGRSKAYFDSPDHLMEFRKELRSLGYSARSHTHADDVAGLRKSVHAVVDCASYCEGAVLEADYELVLCQLVMVMMEFRFQEGSFDRAYKFFACAQDIFDNLRRGALGQELVDYYDLRLDLIAMLSETKWRDTNASRDLLVTPETLVHTWKFSDRALRLTKTNETGTSRIVAEVRLGLTGVPVLKVALRYLERSEMLRLLKFFNTQSGLALSLDTSSEGLQAELALAQESHIKLICVEWQIGKLFTLDCLLREAPGVLNKALLDELHQARLHLSADLPNDPASYQRGIDLEYRWILANMARASLRVNH